MTKLKVLDGTPNEVSLCATCSYAVNAKGYRASDEVVFCNILEPCWRVPFPVRECSKYEDKRLPSLYDMREIAWSLSSKKPGQGFGFVTEEKAGEETPFVHSAPETPNATERAKGKSQALDFRFLFAYSAGR